LSVMNGTKVVLLLSMDMEWNKSYFWVDICPVFSVDCCFEWVHTREDNVFTGVLSGQST
jgi:hypothetical protein